MRFESLEERRVFDGYTFTFANNTWLDEAETEVAYADDDIYVVLYGKDFDTGATWYFDQSGNATEIVAGLELTQVPNFLFSAMTPVDGQAHKYTIELPAQLDGVDGIDSARMYFSMGTEVIAPVVGGNAVQAPVSGDAYVDFIEFTLNKPMDPAQPGNLNIDVTNVDAFGLPLIIDVDGTKVGAATYRAEIISQYESFTEGTPFEQGVWPTDGAHGPYSILSPKDVLDDYSATLKVGSLESYGFLMEAISPTATQFVVSSSTPFPSSPGFSVKIGAETMQVTGITNHANGTATWTVTRGDDPAGYNAQTKFTLVGDAMDDSQTTLSLTGAQNFPTTYPFYVQVGSEIIKVTGVNKVNPGGLVTWNVERAQFESQAASHGQDVNVLYSDVTSNALNNYFNSSIDALFSAYHEPDQKLTVVSTVISGETLTYKGYTTQDSEGNWVLRFNLNGDEDEFDFDVYYPFFQDNAYYWGQSYDPDFSAEAMPSWLTGSGASHSPSQMVFANNGVFNDSAFRQGSEWDEGDRRKIIGDLENQIVSALNRGVALGDWSDSGSYYQSGTYNVYASSCIKTRSASTARTTGSPTTTKPARLRTSAWKVSIPCS